MIKITVAVVTFTGIPFRLRVWLRLRTVIQLRILARAWSLFYGCCCDKACSYVCRYTGTIAVKVMVTAICCNNYEYGYDYRYTVTTTSTAVIVWLL